VKPKPERPNQIRLQGHTAHAELARLAFLESVDERREAVAFMMHVLRGDRVVVRDNVRVAAALALGHLSPDDAHAAVHAMRATLDADVARDATDVTERMQLRWQHDHTLLRCAVATCARTACDACYEAVLAEAKRGARIDLSTLELKPAPRDAVSPAGAFFAWLTARLPALIASDGEEAAKTLERLGLPYAARWVKAEGAHAILVALVDDTRWPLGLRQTAVSYLLQRNDPRSFLAVAARVDNDAVAPKDVVAAIMGACKPAEIYEELAPRLHHKEWRDIIIERLGSGADPRFLDEALRLLATSPDAAVVLLDKLSAKPGPVGDRALDEMRGFVDAARAEGDSPRSGAARRAHKLITARVATRARAADKGRH
jgi:hypothetical protein